MSWNTFTHKITGFWDNPQDYAALLENITGKNEKKSLALYLNQWKIVSETSDFSCPVEFFSSAVPIKSDALVIQLLHVLLMLENTNFYVHALCSDAGTANGKLFRLLRNCELPEKMNMGLEDDMCSFWHPFSDVPRKIYIYHCMVHGLKAIHKNFEKSYEEQNGTKNLSPISAGTQGATPL
jgi:hypothetical protein